MKKIFVLLLLISFSGLTYAQDEELFEYEVYLDAKLVNPSTFKLTLADTSKVLTIGVKPNPSLRLSLPDGVSWSVSSAEVGVAYGKNVLQSEKITEPISIGLLTTLQNHLKKKKHIYENMKPQLIVIFNGVVGTNSSGKMKKFDYLSVTRIDYELQSE